MFESLKAVWKKLEFKMTAHDMLCPPPGAVKQEMEQIGWQYKVQPFYIAAPMVAPPVHISIVSPEGETIGPSTPALYERYREDLRIAAYKVYGM